MYLVTSEGSLSLFLLQIRIRTNNKSKGLKSDLKEITPSPQLVTSDSKITVFDGGDIGNPPLPKPPGIPKRKWECIRVVGNNNLRIVEAESSCKGVRCRYGGAEQYSYTLVPREAALKKLKGTTSPLNVQSALKESIEVKGSSTNRGVANVYSEYAYAGDVSVVVKRRGGGTILHSQSAKKMEVSKYDCLVEYVIGMEQLVTGYSELDIIRRLKCAQEKCPYKTMTSIDRERHAKWYTALANGLNVYLSEHTDNDFGVSVVTAHAVDAEYNEKDRPVVYFVFLRCGHAVALRPGKTS